MWRQHLVRVKVKIRIRVRIRVRVRVGVRVRVRVRSSCYGVRRQHLRARRGGVEVDARRDAWLGLGLGLGVRVRVRGWVRCSQGCQ